MTLEHRQRVRHAIVQAICIAVLAVPMHRILAQSNGGSSLPDVPLPSEPIEWQGPIQEKDGGIGTEIALNEPPPPCCKDVCDGFWECGQCYIAMINSTSWCFRYSR